MPIKRPKQPIALHPIYRGRLDALLAHPNIDKAIAVATRRSLDYTLATTRHQDDLSHFRHLLIETLLIYLHYDREFLNRGPGATKASVSELAAKLNTACPRAVSTLMQRMLDLGRTTKEIADDKRVRRFVPTSLMLEDHLTVSLPFLEALPLVGLGSRTMADIRTNLETFKRYRYAIGRFYADGADPVRPFAKPKPYFSNRARGIAISHYLRLLNIEEFGALTANRPCPINISRMAEQLSISRTHVRNVLDDLTRLELAHFEPGSSVLTFSVGLLDKLRRSMACALILSDEALKVMADMRRKPRRKSTKAKQVVNLTQK